MCVCASAVLGGRDLVYTSFRKERWGASGFWSHCISIFSTSGKRRVCQGGRGAGTGSRVRKEEEEEDCDSRCLLGSPSALRSGWLLTGADLCKGKEATPLPVPKQ